MQEQHINNTNISSETHNQNEIQQEVPQVNCMYVFDQNKQQWFMHEFYLIYFPAIIKAIQQLKITVNKKWKEEHAKDYQRFLVDLEDYIIKYIYSGQVWDFNVFLDAMDIYSKTLNPMGRQLYDTQLDYLQKKSTGYDFSLDKKAKKSKPAQQVKKEPQVKKVIEKKEQVIIRKGDPQINIQALMDTQWPADKYTNIEVFKKENVNIVFIGHVDAGKSSLTGNILKELGQVDEQQWARNKQQAKQNHMQAWQLAGITDVDPNQRKRGKTVQYAKVNFSLANKRFTVFDAPGHKNYVPNMIMGACQADIAILIISSRQGQFQSGFDKQGQTKQHAMLAKALGVSGFLVAITKMGLNDWSQKRFNQIKQSVSPFLQNSCGFTNVKFVPLDSILNLNVHSSPNLPQLSWYKGQCLLDVLNELALPQRKPLAPLRIPLIDKFKQAGNFFLYGKLQSGTIIQQQTITILPPRKQAVIKQIYNAKDQRLPFAMAGQNVKIKVKGVDQTDVKRGDILCNNLNYCQQTYQFKANIKVLQLPDKKKLMATGYQCILHMHAIAEQIQIINVQAKFNKQANKYIAATFLKAGQQGNVTIKCENILCLQKYEFMASLGRFTLRDQGKTVGYGTVTKIKPAKKLLDQQKEQLGLKKEEKTLQTALENVSISN